MVQMRKEIISGQLLCQPLGLVCTASSVLLPHGYKVDAATPDIISILKGRMKMEKTRWYHFHFSPFIWKVEVSLISMQISVHVLLAKTQ